MSKDEKPEIHSIDPGGVKETKKSIWGMIADEFKVGDVKDVRSYISEDVVPQMIHNGVKKFKDGMFDIITDTIHILVYQSPKQTKKSGGSIFSTGDTIKVDYSKKYKSERSERRSESSLSLDYLEFNSRSIAQEVLDEMNRLIRKYDNCSVNDLKQIIQKVGNSEDPNWGWTEEISSSCIRARRGNYILDLPKPVRLHK